MKFLEVRIPPPLVGLLFAGAMWLIARPGPHVGLPARETLATALAIVGFGVMFAGLVSFRIARTTINPLKPSEATSLVTGGVYRYTRNPMYLGMLVVLVGWAVFLAAPLTLVAVVAFFFYIQRFQIQPEERALTALFGAAYTRYTQRVRRWL